MNSDINNYYNNRSNSLNTMPYNFKVGIYVRLSREDDDKSYRQSESIINQKDSLVNFVLQNKWTLVDIYSDDGYTGLNFDRPDFKRMISDIEAGKINMVVTKDMSRLGRDYISTGHYIERYFPMMNVRYIALNDGVDTFENSSNNDMGPFKTVMNDMYAKDISRKVRFSMDGKKRSGKFIGSFAPYGYKKSAENKNQLTVDPGAAENVRRIFAMYLDGQGLTKIADTLNKEGILTPAQYKQKNISKNYKHGTAKNMLWTGQTIVKIIENPTYAGNLTQNRYRKVNYKIKKLKNLPKSEWITVNGTHEPIISLEDFEEAQRLRKIKCGEYFSYNPKAHEHLLAGLIYCGDCGEKMTFSRANSNKKFFIICSRYKRFKLCKRHSIEENLLNEYVISELKKMAGFAANKNELESIAKNTKKSSNKEKSIIVEIEKSKKRTSEILKLIKLMYEDKLKGSLNETDFLTMIQEFSQERKALEEKIKSLENKLNSIKDKEASDLDIFNVIENMVSFKTISKTEICKLIDKIIVYDKTNIVIHYRFKNPFQV